ncbi:hypothetical protein B484DRAFT_447746 [Ochromonadaceae sp. CCMP2298]|nr:hypothetical protein B484DRAFT_447746 [Ochromonadaceae sp. CCMP2298]
MYVQLLTVALLAWQAASFHLHSSRLHAVRPTMLLDSFNIASIDLVSKFGLMPLCLDATSKTTTQNDPTAGMSPEEITNYISNVGGGMCGQSESVRALIGLSLNLSLIVFGFFTVSYVVLGGLNFSLDKNVEDLIEKASKEGGQDGTNVAALAAQMGLMEGKKNPTGLDAIMAEEKREGANRSERRFNKNYLDKDNKK